MRTRSKTAFRPSLERVEARVVATGGVVSAAAHHAPPPPAAHVESHHASRPRHHPAPHHEAARHPAPQPQAPQSPTPQPEATTTTTTASNPQSTITTPSPWGQQAAPAPAPSPALATNTTTNQAWVEIVNTTGQALEYYIKLDPYTNGQFLPSDIGPGQTQYWYSSLISNGQRVKADFAIQFGNGPITPLNTGISEAWAQGYYIFLDSNSLQPYVYPFIKS